MKLLRNIFSEFHVYMLWLLASVMFWAWIFTIITDTRPKYKVTIFADTYDAKTTELAMKLEEDIPEGLKMIKVRLFQYAMFTGDEIDHADLFIIRGSEAEQYISAFQPLRELALPYDSETCYSYEGEDYGILIRGEGSAALTEYLTYDAEGASGENYYLFLGSRSLHLGLEESVDSAALQIAERLFNIE